MKGNCREIWQRPTQRAPDPCVSTGIVIVGESARFRAVCVARSWFRQSRVISSRPAGSSLSRSPADTHTRRALRRGATPTQAVMLLSGVMKQSYQEITLVRHGRSSHPLATHRITAAEFRTWIVDYNQAGIAADSLPAPELIAATCDMRYVVCSDMPRAIASASLLSPGRAPCALPLLREAGRPVSGNWRVKLPLAMWDCISVFLWTMGLIASDESVGAARLRAQEAACELVRLVEEFSRVLCVGHGMFNAFVGQALLDLGWEGPPRVANRHWAATTYRKRALDTAA
jgi:broad specificity phosphatase PhoE